MAGNILMVLDADFRFEPPAPTAKFTYTILVGALEDAGFTVTRAHRGSDDSAEHTDFLFDGPLDLSAFDLIWMIGDAGLNQSTDNSPKLSETELLAIATFMDSGGGVFATGDHNSIGSKMCGEIPRVRAMRKWFAGHDPLLPAGFPGNWPPTGTDRADTIQPNQHGDGGTYFENQSDSTPQPIQRVPPAGPTHPILRNGDHDVAIFPDHMHEGDAIAGWPGFDWNQILTFSGTPVTEFPTLTGDPDERPRVIATGEGLGHATPGGAGAFSEPSVSTPKTIGILAAYDGFSVGVGRVVTGSTFHHYVDINLTGDPRVSDMGEIAAVGEDAMDTHGFAWPMADPDVFADIKAVYVNIAGWLSRPRRSIRLILDRSTFGQDEVHASLMQPSPGEFERSVFVVVEGTKPSDYPGTLDNIVNPTGAQLQSWAPEVVATGTNIAIEPTGVDSSDPMLLERFQTFTFEYRVTFPDESAFGFAGQSDDVPVHAERAIGGATFTDDALFLLVKTANPFMLDLADGNDTSWLSSDVRVFTTVADGGGTFAGQTLPNGAGPAAAITFIRNVIANVTPAQFAALPPAQEDSPLSPYPTADDGSNVYNFALARVRLRGDAAVADNVRVFFRLFESQTTAALTYRAPGGVPVDSYLRTPGGSPIALPGISQSGTEYISFPCFATARDPDPADQVDTPNLRPAISPTPGGETLAFFGCLIDSNRPDMAYLKPSPGSMDGPISLSEHLMSAHQCIVAEINFAGTPIQHDSNPATSDKLAQRNIALDEIANPGTDASRVATHTFEIEATPDPIADHWRPDELMLEWKGKVPEGATISFFVPTWSAEAVIALADRLYTRHGLRMADPETIECAAGGTVYIPLPRSLSRQVGLVSAAFPLGVRKGQRFDCLVRQVTNRYRRVVQQPAKAARLDPEEAERLVKELREKPRPGILVAPAYLLDETGDQPMVVETPNAAEAERAVLGRWRETVGAFQLGIPVSDKASMLVPYLRLLSLMYWRGRNLKPSNRWYPVFRRYVAILADKVRALGGNPDTVPATPDGVWEGMPGRPGGDHGGGKDPCRPEPCRPDPCGDVKTHHDHDHHHHQYSWPAWLLWLPWALLFFVLLLFAIVAIVWLGRP
ncbi:MAG TPA: hypothetical protein VIT45_15735 [Allosphingosinicella sp.]